MGSPSARSQRGWGTGGRSSAWPRRTSRSYGGPGKDRIYGGRGNDRLYGGPGKDWIGDHRGATTAFAGSGMNLVDVADGRGDDRVVCTPGTITGFFADRGDRIARSCLERRRPRSEAAGRVRSGGSTSPRMPTSKYSDWPNDKREGGRARPRRA
jgi:hypothetical protein